MKSEPHYMLARLRTVKCNAPQWFRHLPSQSSIQSWITMHFVAGQIDGGQKVGFQAIRTQFRCSLCSCSKEPAPNGSCLVASNSSRQPSAHMSAAGGWMANPASLPSSTASTTSGATHPADSVPATARPADISPFTLAPADCMLPVWDPSSCRIIGLVHCDKRL